MMKENCCGENHQLCVNPLHEIYVKCKQLVSTDLSVSAALTQLLNSGAFLSNHGSYCCPDCSGKKGFYFIGNYSVFIVLMQSTQQMVPAETSYVPTKYPCCWNHSLTGENAVSYAEDFENLKAPCCDTNFPNVLLELTSYGIDTENIIEASSFNNESGLKYLLDLMVLEEETEDFIKLFFETLFTIGVVIKCLDCDIYIGSVSSYISFASAYELIPRVIKEPVKEAISDPTKK